MMKSHDEGGERRKGGGCEEGEEGRRLDLPVRILQCVTSPREGSGLPGCRFQFKLKTEL